MDTIRQARQERMAQLAEAQRRRWLARQQIRQMSKAHHHQPQPYVSSLWLRAMREYRRATADWAELVTAGDKWDTTLAHTREESAR